MPTDLPTQRCLQGRLSSPSPATGFSEVVARAGGDQSACTKNESRSTGHALLWKSNVAENEGTQIRHFTSAIQSYTGTPLMSA